MKLSEFYDKPQNKPKKPQILAFNNEVKEAQMMAKVVDLETKIASFEVHMEEKSTISKQLSGQRVANQELSTTIEENTIKIAYLEAETQEKHRIVEEIEGLKRSNSQLLASHGEMTASLALVSTECSSQVEELVHLRETNGSLDIARQSMFNESLIKDTLLQELRAVLTDLKDKHETLTSFSNTLGQQYAEVVETKNKLDKHNLKLHTDFLIAKTQYEELEHQGKYNIENNTKAITQRIKGTMNKTIIDLQQDVKDLVKINSHYKTELNKPQHMSVGAIARQEGFKIPLASSAINYRKNTLGTGKPTLLKFGTKENS